MRAIVSFLFVGLLSLPVLAGVDDSATGVLAGDAYAFLNHASPMFEPDGNTVPGVEGILRASALRGIPVVGVVSGPDQQHYQLDKVTKVAKSISGHVAFRFPSARVFVLGGGNLSMCLCELMRDILVGSGAKEANLVLVTDAIYDPRMSWPLSAEGMEPGQTFLLSQLVERTRDNPAKLVEYFEDGFIGARGLFGLGEGRFCRSNHDGATELDKSNLKFSVVVDGVTVDTFGRGRKPVRFILTESARLEETLRALGR